MADQNDAVTNGSSVRSPKPVSQSKDRDTDSKSTATNPFETSKVSSYSHKPNFVPVYVLDTLSQAHYKEQLTNTNSVYLPDHPANHSNTTTTPTKRDEDDYLSFAHDPFVRSMDNNWHKFLTSIKQPNTYSHDVLSFDKHTVFENKLDGSWGGEVRLKTALLGTPSTDDDTFSGEGHRWWFRSLFTRKEPIRSLEDNPRVRSKAGYWMSTEKRADLFPMLKRIFVVNPLVPLMLRIMIIFFSACALGLACTIFQFSNHKYGGSKVEQQPSTIMAIVVQCLAIVYVAYISYDEYTGKPLGLRDPLGKMKLIMLDLLFIIFSSANLSLTFNTLYQDEWVCQSDRDEDIASSSSTISFFTPTVASICRRQRGLAAFLFLVLNLWVLTFTISIIRLVDRVTVAGHRTD
ncbi:hypothetical protein CANTEDRAFT_126002 [Yamadazyma tenuis ATCC 10573]|uniref:Regulator of phospholipase D SRF1 n=1 Tax=Candida tenuis (strain ATCC 10573 / BCRC 21748 / CBS 615 / JCM 9827 / NBRC 10315 / NRRL Y-1498 / VKM Y-70) TaxID=590646 RepID=G3B7Q6_CANTC|nr:uncharacterized protein CANTEDRAFT_126002 [Yamadazyma tenuis ATCC 10573]EGV62843.1 hypothetical protein CANTEDRAFT_126002 [Yamadazyma tenuis ATCC 10573]